MSSETYVLHVTKKCNMNCAYCYETDKTSTYTKQEIKKVLDDIISNSPQEFHLEFLGGEPMLAWDNIVFAVDYLRESGKSVNYTITTNGTILKSEHIDFIKDNNINFAVSIDGFGIAGIFRTYKDGRQTFANAMDNIRVAQEFGIENSVHIVNHPYNVGWLYDSVEDFYERDVRVVAAGIIESVLNIDDEFCNEYVKQMCKISDAIKDGRFDGLYVVELESLKPEDDVRTYVRDDSGRVVFESYGRADGDITSMDLYDVQRCEDKSETSIRINNLRKYVYDYHHEK